MVVSELERSTHKLRSCRAGTRLASLPRDAPCTAPGEVQGEGFCHGRIHQEEEERRTPSRLSHLPARFPPPTPKRWCWLAGWEE